MLYDKRWEKPEVKADPFRLESLISWLEKQQADKEYDFQNCDGECLVGQYMTSISIPWDFSVYLKFRDAFAEKNYEPSLYRTGVFRIGAVRPHTFGAALDRAREALKSRTS